MSAIATDGDWLRERTASPVFAPAVAQVPIRNASEVRPRNFVNSRRVT